MSGQGNKTNETNQAKPPNFGFILTRHVNNARSNLYWQECYRCIRHCYPEVMVMIIDDNSNYDHIHIIPTTPPLLNCIILKSEFPGRGELLAYYYFLKIRPFDRAMIIHDSVFIQPNFVEQLEAKLLAVENAKFIWDFPHYYDDTPGEKPYFQLLGEGLMGYPKCNRGLIEDICYFHGVQMEWRGCFGVMSVITYDFLKHLDEKFHLFQWFEKVVSRNQRYYIERVFAVLCCLEERTACHSLLGDIYKYSISWEYQWEDYLMDKSEKRNRNFLKSPIVKVWSRR